MTYREKLSDPRWQRLRLQIFERDRFTCRACGDSKRTLHVHHKRYCAEPWEADRKDLVTLCSQCHNNVEIVIKMVRNNPHVVLLPHLLNRSFLLHNKDPKLLCALLKKAIQMCDEP